VRICEHTRPPRCATRGHDERQAGQIREGGPGALFSVASPQHTFRWDLMDGEGLLDLGHGSASFLLRRAIACSTEGTEPLQGVSVHHGHAGAHHVPSCASGGAWGTEGTSTPLWCRKGGGLRERSLAGGFSGSIESTDDPLAFGTIPKTCSHALWPQRSSEQIQKKQVTQGFDWLWGESGSKAREGRTCWQALSPNECQERMRTGMEMLGEGFRVCSPLIASPKRTARTSMTSD